MLKTNPSSTSISTATIHVIFDQEMDINSFRFKDNEIPDSATPLYDENNTIYDYENNGRILHFCKKSQLKTAATTRLSNDARFHHWTAFFILCLRFIIKP
ncbi:MAG: hypothetical protein Q4B64_00915 [Spirochaetales bacterium]|nr:hypothetical protein [Spirochaetales bacterium]